MSDVAVDNQAAPPLTQSDAIASLLSLSFVEAGLGQPKLEPAPQQALTPAQTPSTSLPNGGKHHRRLSSTGKTRRRLSDAREAANRPSPSLLQSNSTGLSLASLSLSSSPPLPSYPAQLSTSFAGASRKLAPAPPSNPTALSGNIPVSSTQQNANAIPVGNGDEEANETGAIPIPSSNGKTAKKRGIDHKCESCSKIYRHPSCLIKHRWEHTPHWREASKFVLSKHQQVQLLEAAAILSHMSPAASGGKSLPEDRSLWPSFLSGGSLPPPEPPMPSNRSNANGDSPHNPTPISPSVSYGTHPVSSSVPARPMSSGPRLHDYGVGTGVVTQVRPGLVGVTTSMGGVAVIGDKVHEGSATPSQPVPVPAGGAQGRRGHDFFGGNFDNYYRHRTSASRGGDESWESPSYNGGYYSSNIGGVSLPNSSVRSGSSPPRSLSRSRSGSVERGPGTRKREGRLSGDDSPSSDDGIFEHMDGIEEDRGIRIVGDRYSLNGHLHPGSKSYDSYPGRYSSSYGHGRTSSYSGRRFVKRDEDEELDEYHLAVREEDEDMDDMDGMGRLRKPVLLRKEEQWDGMEMDMDMD